MDRIPAEVPYLRVPAQAPDPAGAPRVGLVWQGRPQHPYDRERSIALRDLRPLLDVPGLHFVSLQHGAGREQLEAEPLEDLGGTFQDFADAAAAIAGLDLVISIDSAIAHLAGALGKPVWLLLPFAPDWRWMIDREDSPWYPTMRLFRQRRPGGWDEVVARVADVLSRDLRRR